MNEDATNPATFNLFANVTDADRADAVTAVLQGIGVTSESWPDVLVYTFNGSTGQLTLDPSQFNRLSEGQTLTILVNYTVSDGQVSVPASATLTVTGSNDLPVLSLNYTVSGSNTVAEATDAHAQNLSAITGTLSVTDADRADTLTASAGTATAELNGGAITLSGSAASLLSGLSFSGTPGSGSGATQNINWTYDPAAADLDFLKAGDTLVITFPVTVSDGHGSSNTQNITITITGTNDVPTIAANTTGGVTEAGGTANGTAGTATVTGDVSLGGTNWTDLDRTEDATLAITKGSAGSNTQASLSFNGGPNSDEAVITGTYGTLYIKANGEYRYVLDNNSAATQGLDGGDTPTDVFHYTIGGSGAGSATADIIITVTGSNDNPVLATVTQPSAVTEIVNAAAQSVSLSGVLSVTDADANDTLTASATTAVVELNGNAFTLPPGAASLLSGLTFGTANSNNGAAQNLSWTYSPVAADLDFLRAGQTLTITFPVTVSDGTGNSSTENLVITITGSNDGPVAVADSNGADAVTEAGDQPLTAGDSSASGNVLTNDTDKDAGDTKTVTGVEAGSGAGPVSTGVGSTITGTYGTLTLNADGSWSYTLNNADADTNGLAAGQAATDVFTYTMKDGSDATSTSTLTINITGSNDAPVITPVVTTGSMTETAGAGSTGTPSTVSGSFSFADADLNDRPGTGPGNLTTTLAVTPGTLSAAQITAAEALISAFSTSLGSGATNNGTVNWSFTPASGQFDFLRELQTATLTFTVTVADGKGGTASQNVVITLTGTNDAVSIEPGGTFTGSAAEANAATPLSTPVSITNSFQFKDADLAGNPVQIIPNGGNAFGGSLSQTTAVTNAATGIKTLTWTYANTQANLDRLGAGDSVTEIFTIRVLDQSGGGTIEQFVTITLTGTNDVPVLSAATLTVAGSDLIVEATNAAAQDLAPVSGTLTVSDVDSYTADILTASVTGDAVVKLNGNAFTLPGSAANLDDAGNFSFTGNGIAATGSNQSIGWTFNPAAANLDFLAAGDELTLTYTVRVNDGTANSGTQTITITITGTNDAPTISAEAAGTLIDTAANNTLATLSGELDGADVDRGAVLTYTIDGQTLSSGQTVLTGTYGTLTVNADGTYSYVPNNAAINALPEGGSTTDTFTVKVTDEHGVSATQTLTVNITAANDTPTITAESAGSIVDTAGNDTSYAPLTGALDGADRDTGHVLTYTIDGQAPSSGQTVLTGTYGTLTVNTDGTYSYAANTTAVNALDPGSYTDQFTVKVTDQHGASSTTTLTVNLTGANDAPIINEGASNLTRTGTEDSANITGTIVATDADDGTLTYSIISGASGTFGTVTINSSGAYTFDPANNWSGQHSFTVQVSDGNGGLDTVEVNVDVAPDADAPTLTLAGSVTPVAGDEDTSINLRAITSSLDDTDGSESLSLTLTGFPSGATFSVGHAVGNTWVIDNPADIASLATTPLTMTPPANYNGSFTLNVTATATDTATLSSGTATDTATTSGSFTVTVTAVNDVPVITVTDVTESVTEAVSGTTAVTGTGSFSASDVDTTDTVSASHGAATVVWSGGDLAADHTAVYNALRSAGALSLVDGNAAANAASYAWSYDAGALNLNFLAEGETITVTYTVNVTDGTATVPQTVTITITGDNDAPVLTVTPNTGTVEDTAANDSYAAVTGTLSATDVDHGATQSFGIDGGVSGSYSGYNVAKATAYGTLYVNSATGAYSFIADDAAVEGLINDASVVFDVTVSDGLGGTDSKTLTITIDGANDTPELTASVTAATRTDTANDDTFAPVSGSLSVTDRDIGDGRTLSIVGVTEASDLGGYMVKQVSAYGTLYLNTTSGDYTFIPNDAAIEGLKSNTTVSFDLRVTDTGGLFDTETLTISITGANDTPVLTASLTAATITDTAADNTFADITGTLSRSDRDAGDTYAFGVTGGTPAPMPEASTWRSPAPMARSM